MILQVTACEYLGRTETGRSKPMRCICEDNSGNSFNAYVKYANFHEDFDKDHLVGETVANLLALEMGLPAATPCLVKIDPEFVDLLPDTAECDQLRVALNLAPLVAFGSIQLEPVRRWASTDLIHKSQRRDATFLYLYDTLVENTDRGIRNPNLLMSGLHFRVIDFGHSFQRCHDGNDFQGIKKPWEPEGVKNHYPGDLQHIMYSGISPVDEDVLNDFQNVLSGLDDDRINDYVECVPTDWGQDTACKIVDYLLEARAHATEFIDQARRVLR